MQELKLSLRWFPFSVSRFSCFTRKSQIVLDFSIEKKPWGLLKADLLSQREETDLLSLAIRLESNLMGRLPNMLCDTRLVWSGSISLYSVPLNLTVKFAATLVTFLRKLYQIMLSLDQGGGMYPFFKGNHKRNRSKNKVYRITWNKFQRGEGCTMKKTKKNKKTENIHG